MAVPSEIREAADLLKLASDPRRLTVLLMLGERELTVGAIVSELGAHPSSVSHLLAQMRMKGLVTGTRDGQNVIYSHTPLGRELASLVQCLVICLEPPPISEAWPP
jgi:DNA-binding transcriptional ArsR family regulator